MACAERNRTLQIGLRQLGGLARQSVHQVNIPTIEAGACCHVERASSVVSAVDAAQSLQQGILKRLYANTQPVYTGCAISCKALSLRAARVRLERDFGVISNLELSPNTIQQPRDPLAFKQTWCATTDKNGSNCPIGQLVRLAGQVGE